MKIDALSSEYTKTKHFQLAQDGSQAATEIFHNSSWCYTHGFFAEMIRLMYPGEEWAVSLSKKLLNEVKEAA